MTELTAALGVHQDQAEKQLIGAIFLSDKPDIDNCLVQLDPCMIRDPKRAEFVRRLKEGEDPHQAAIEVGAYLDFMALMTSPTVTGYDLALYVREIIRDYNLAKGAALVSGLGQAFSNRDLEAVRKFAESLLALEPAESSPAEPKVKTRWTVAELVGAEFEDPAWAVPGIIPAGLSLLGGKPKLGKSWLALQLAHSVGTGGQFAGVKVEQGPVLYLALEDSPRRLKDRLIKQRAPHSAQITFQTEWKISAMGGLADLQNDITANGYRLVIIDTLSRFLGGRVDQKDAGEVTEALGALQHFAVTHNIAILIIDHHRKNNGLETGDPIEDVLGSISKGGVVDCGMGLYRKRGEHGATLKITGRDVAERELSLQWDGGLFCWQYVGEANQVREDSEKGRVLAAALALYEDGEIPTTTRISNSTGIDLGNVSKCLGDLVGAGLLVKVDRKDGRQQPYIPVSKGGIQ